MQTRTIQINQAGQRRAFAVYPAFASAALLAGLLFCAAPACAQTLMFGYSFDAASSTSTNTTSDSGLLAPITLQFRQFVGGTTTNFVDLRAGANSGVQGQGGALNFTNSPDPALLPALVAEVTTNVDLAKLGDGATVGSTFSNFTATLWFKPTQNIANPVSGQGGILFQIGVNGNYAPGGANSISFRMINQPGVNGLTNSFLARLNGSSAQTILAPIYFDTPTNLWMFMALVYNRTNNNAYLYFGTEGSPAKLVAVKNIGPQVFNFGASGSASLHLGNANGFTRHIEGFMDDFRFYTGGDGAANGAFIEGVRQARTPVVISGLYPDGLGLLQGTNTLAFTASSANGIDPARISVAVNGNNVSGSLSIGGPATARTVSYTGLPVNPIPPAGVPNLNKARITISVTDSNNITTTNGIVYDAFSPTNYIWEAEDYDFGTNQFIDNPAYSFLSGPTTYTNRQGGTNLDYFDGAGTAPHVYRLLDRVGTDFNNTAGDGNSVNYGELMRDKVLAALVLNAEGNESIREMVMNNFAAGDWVNYTRTYPAGLYQVYLRAAAGGSVTSSLSTVTGGWGTTVQTSNVLGGFSFNNSGGSQDYAWIPLRTNGALGVVALGGTNTLKLTAGTGGGGNVNFLMLVPVTGPLISLQPASQSVVPGTNATFAVQAVAPGGLTYQWQRSAPGVTNFVDIPGATSAAYTTPVLTVAADNQAQYWVLASSGGITVTSSVAVLTVAYLPGIERFYIGTYSGAIYQNVLNLAAVPSFGTSTNVATIAQPSFVALTPDRRFLYSVDEGNGKVAAYAVNSITGGLTLLNQLNSGILGGGNADAPAHIAVDGSGKMVFVGNYNGGSVSTYLIQPNGSLVASAFIQEPATNWTGAAAAAHAHFIGLDNAHHFAFLCDLGLEQIRCFIFDPVLGTMIPNTTFITPLAVGSGPRHMTFDPQFQHAYVINQNSNNIVAFNYDSANGILTPFQTNTTLPAGLFAGNTTAEIVMHPTGKFLYGSNRGGPNNSIAVFQVSPVNGTITLVQNAITGATPRNFAIDPTGTYCLVADQGSNDIRLFAIDPVTGLLTYLNTSTAVSQPVCIVPFLQVPPQPVLTASPATEATFTLSVANTLNFLTYQVFESTNLAPGSVWNLVTNGAPGQAGFVLTNSLNQDYFKVGVLTNY